MKLFISSFRHILFIVYIGEFNSMYEFRENSRWIFPSKHGSWIQPELWGFIPPDAIKDLQNNSENELDIESISNESLSEEKEITVDESRWMEWTWFTAILVIICSKENTVLWSRSLYCAKLISRGFMFIVINAFDEDSNIHYHEKGWDQFLI